MAQSKRVREVRKSLYLTLEKFGKSIDRIMSGGIGGISMSTLEKTITLLREMPEQSLESLYDFIQSIWIRQDANSERPEKTANTSKSMEGFQVLQSFAGTLPADFDYKKELEEMRDEKYRRFD